MDMLSIDEVQYTMGLWSYMDYKLNWRLYVCVCVWVGGCGGCGGVSDAPANLLRNIVLEGVFRHDRTLIGL